MFALYMKRTGTTGWKLFALVTGLCIALNSAVVTAQDDSRRYLLDEPVFNGKSYVIEAGRKNPELIVLVHGLGDMAASTWEPFIPELARHYHVLSFDLPGFGRSSKSNELYSPDKYVAFIDYVVKKTGHKRFMLVGHSLGGNIALRYASTHPDKVKRLMLIDAAGVLHRVTYSNFLAHFGIRILPQFYPQQEDDLKSITSLIWGELAANNGLFEYGERLMLQDPGVRQSVLGGNPSAIAAYAMIMTDYSDSLAGLNVPTLILWGRDDKVIPLRTAKVLATNIPRAGLVVFDQTGHSPMHEQPTRFRQWLSRFAGNSEQAFAQLIANTRYVIDRSVDNISERVVHCKNTNNQLYVGDYKALIIENCQNVEIDSARIKSLSISHSSVTLNNCDINSNGKGILVQNSDVQINGCRISGSPAVSFIDSSVDIAGTQLLSTTGAALQNLSRQPGSGRTLPGPLNGLTARDTVLFSLTQLSSHYSEKHLHGPANIKPGQYW